MYIQTTVLTQKISDKTRTMKVLPNLLLLLLTLIPLATYAAIDVPPENNNNQKQPLSLEERKAMIEKLRNAKNLEERKAVREEMVRIYLWISTIVYLSVNVSKSYAPFFIMVT